MTLRATFLFFCCLFLLAATAGAARAQAIVVLNHSLARDCYLFAKLGNNLQRGIEICGDALRDQPMSRHDQAATYDNRGVMEKLTGRTDEALADFSRAIAADGTLGDTYVNRAAILIAREKYDAALDDLNRALEVGLEQPHLAYYDRGLALHMLGRYPEAYRDYRQALALRADFKLAQDMLKYFVVTRVAAK